MCEGKNPANKRQRALRIAIRKARAFAEQTALQNIQMAGLDPSRWQANAWFLQNSIQKKYLKSAKAIYKPQVEITAADISRAIQMHREGIVVGANGDTEGLTHNGDGDGSV
jgi:hypothetical protein